MENHSVSVSYKILRIRKEAQTAMERFFSKNDIPFIIAEEGTEHVAYSLRAGMDYNDAVLYFLKSFGDLKNPDTINTINLLVLEHEFLDVQYVYECYAELRKDESLLGSFVFRDDRGRND